MKDHITSGFKGVKNLIKSINPFNSNDNVDTGFYVIKKVLAFITIYILSIFVAEGVLIGIHFIMGLNPLKGEMLDMQSMLLMKYYGFVIFII